MKKMSKIADFCVKYDMRRFTDKAVHTAFVFLFFLSLISWSFCLPEITTSQSVQEFAVSLPQMQDIEHTEPVEPQSWLDSHQNSCEPLCSLSSTRRVKTTGKLCNTAADVRQLLAKLAVIKLPDRYFSQNSNYIALLYNIALFVRAGPQTV